MSELILIADDDCDVAGAIGISLELEGFTVVMAADGLQALEMVRELHPDLVLLDVTMPRMNGIDVCRALRADSRTHDVSVIFLTARSMSIDKLAGFHAGADDFVVKPFEPEELVARVQSVLRRTREMRDLSPLTQLPGNRRIACEIEALVARPDAEFAVLYADLNNFKAYNDHYGFLRGDEVIKFTAQVVTGAMSQCPGVPSFAGHVGGDDFIMLCHPSFAETACQVLIDTFDAKILDYYDPADIERGFIETADRRGEKRRHPPISIAVGVASTERRPIRSQWEASVISSEMKSHAKRHGGSAYEIDRREV